MKPEIKYITAVDNIYVVAVSGVNQQVKYDSIGFNIGDITIRPDLRVICYNKQGVHLAEIVLAVEIVRVIQENLPVEVDEEE